MNRLLTRAAQSLKAELQAGCRPDTRCRKARCEITPVKSIFDLRENAYGNSIAGLDAIARADIRLADATEPESVPGEVIVEQQRKIVAGGRQIEIEEKARAYGLRGGKRKSMVGDDKRPRDPIDHRCALSRIRKRVRGSKLQRASDIGRQTCFHTAGKTAACVLISGETSERIGGRQRSEGNDLLQGRIEIGDGSPPPGTQTLADAPIPPHPSIS